MSDDKIVSDSDTLACLLRSVLSETSKGSQKVTVSEISLLDISRVYSVKYIIILIIVLKVVSCSPPIEFRIFHIFPLIVHGVAVSIDEQSLWSMRELRIIPELTFLNDFFVVNFLESFFVVGEGLGKPWLHLSDFDSLSS